MTHTSTRSALLGGILLSVGGSIGPKDLLRTALLAAVGASVSFLISILLKRMLGWYHRRRSKADHQPGKMNEAAR